MMTVSPATGVPPAAVHRRTWSLVFVLTAVFGLLIWAASRTYRGFPANDETVLRLLIPLLILICLPFLSHGWWATVHAPGGRYVTASSLTGRRTIDLHRLERIWRHDFLSSYRRADQLVLRDANGIWLVSRDPDVLDAVRAAMAAGANRSARISRPAAYVLDLITAPPLVRGWWMTSYYLAIIGYLAAVFLVVVGMLEFLSRLP